MKTELEEAKKKAEEAPPPSKPAPVVTETSEKTLVSGYLILHYLPFAGDEPLLHWLF